MKKYVVALAMPLLVAGMLYAQTFGSVDNAEADTEIEVDTEKGFSAQIDIDTNLFGMTQTTFSDAKDRFHRTDYFLADNLPFGGFNVLDDTYVGFGYNGGWYGGNFSVGSGGLGGIKAWVSFFDNKFKITAGNDIGYGYADSQGADAGLRIYDDNAAPGTAVDKTTVDSNKNPDNITQGKGILFELDFDPLKIAIAGGSNLTDFATNMGSTGVDNNMDPTYGLEFQYGVNIGGKIGGVDSPFAKVNAAYVLQYKKDKTKYEAQPGGDQYATSPGAETQTHLAGVFAAFYPARDDTLGITVGYAAELTQYLKEYGQYNTEAVMPQVFKNGINLTARYKPSEKLTLKTDHNYSFWTDRNYRIFNFFKPEENTLIDYGTEKAPLGGAGYSSNVYHSLLWNGIGASYIFTPVVEGSVYARNLLRTDKTPEFTMTNDYMSLELKGTFRFSPSVEAYCGINAQYTLRTVSEDLVVLSHEYLKGTPAEAVDSVFALKIPVGFTVRFK
jgi:hypothetical protein